MTVSHAACFEVGVVQVLVLLSYGGARFRRHLASPVPTSLLPCRSGWQLRRPLSSSKSFGASRRNAPYSGVIIGEEVKMSDGPAAVWARAENVRDRERHLSGLGRIPRRRTPQFLLVLGNGGSDVPLPSGTAAMIVYTMSRRRQFRWFKGSGEDHQDKKWESEISQECVGTETRHMGKQTGGI